MAPVSLLWCKESFCPIFSRIRSAYVFPVLFIIRAAVIFALMLSCPEKLNLPQCQQKHAFPLLSLRYRIALRVYLRVSVSVK